MAVQFVEIGDRKYEIRYPGGVAKIENRQQFLSQMQNWEKFGSCAIERIGEPHSVLVNSDGSFSTGPRNRYETIDEARRECDSRNNAALSYFNQFGLCGADG